MFFTLEHQKMILNKAKEATSKRQLLLLAYNLKINVTSLFQSASKIPPFSFQIA